MAFDRTKPQNTEKLKNTPALIRANWDAIATGTDPELLITNAKISATANIADTKLAQITTAGKVSGAALTSLASIPAGAGAIPVANIPDLAATKITSGTLSSDRLDTGTTANKILKLDADAKIPAVDGSLLTNIKPSDLAIASQARGDILYFNGTNWVRLAKGTDGQYLKIGANDPAWASVSASGYQVYTSGSGNWTCPTGITRVTVTCVGGGGGGASGGGDNDPGGGGQSGHTVTVVYKVTAGNNYAYSVGALGAGATAFRANGSAGGNTTFGTGVVITALGGLGGVKNGGVPAITYGTTYGAGFFHNGAADGTGGSTYWGAGGVRKGHYTAGTAGGGYGAGGGGGYGNGGNGVGGVILIEY